MPRLALSPVRPERADADLLVLPVAAGEDGPAAPPVTAAVLAALGADLAGVSGGAGRFTGALDDALLLPAYGAVAAPAVLLVGVGPDADRSAETLRRAAAVAVAAAGKAATMATALHQAGLPAAADGSALAAVAEGTVLAAYRFQRHKSAPDPDLAAATLLVDGDAALAAADPVLHRAEVAARATLAARDLVNEPASRINPATLAAEAVRLAKAAGLEHEVLTGPALRRGRFGAVVAVGGGSATGPRLVRLRYRPAGAGRHVALVGKGVTFDTGGIDLKRGASMDGMKDDMAGAAAILAAVTAAAELELPTAVTAVLPLVENMPGGSAMRPGDVVTARNGITVEVTNTDAEGRLILADGLALAAEDGPDAILDLATLTGSVVYGLGLGCTGVFGNTPALTADVLAAAARAGELACELPIIEDYRRFLDSEVADLINASNEPGDSVQAALFLREFVAGTPWVHLDIAGPASAKEARYYQPKGASGWGSGPCWRSWKGRGDLSPGACAAGGGTPRRGGVRPAGGPPTGPSCTRTVTGCSARCRTPRTPSLMPPLGLDLGGAWAVRQGRSRAGHWPPGRHQRGISPRLADWPGSSTRPCSGSLIAPPTPPPAGGQGLPGASLTGVLAGDGRRPWPCPGDRPVGERHGQGGGRLRLMARPDRPRRRHPLGFGTRPQRSPLRLADTRRFDGSDNLLLRYEVGRGTG